MLCYRACKLFHASMKSTFINFWRHSKQINTHDLLKCYKLHIFVGMMISKSACYWANNIPVKTKLSLKFLMTVTCTSQPDPRTPETHQIGSSCCRHSRLILPRDAVRKHGLARCPSVCLSVRHVHVLYREV